MQGRMSPAVDGRIQVFPWLSWQSEFALADEHGFRLMEWTLDHDRLYENPLLTRRGRREIRECMSRHNVAIPSLTGDCFMHAPFWKADAAERAALEHDFMAVAMACGEIGIGIMVVPLVDNGRLETPAQEVALVAFLESVHDRLRELGLRVVFESDFAPNELSRFITQLDDDTFGINYDTGNSAALGFDSVREISAYGHRIVNTHVKDRKLGGTTVPLGSGAANFPAVFAALAAAGYQGNYILQTARALDDDHAGVLRRYRDMTTEWLKAA